MKLMSEYRTEDNGVDFDLKFYDRLTLINGDSGVGKTLLFKAIERDTLLLQTNIICLNYDDISSGNITHILDKTSGHVIIIDNADIALSLEQRIQISMDQKNQYIIFSHTTQGFFPNEKSIAELIVKKNKGILLYPLMKKEPTHDSHMA